MEENTQTQVSQQEKLYAVEIQPYGEGWPHGRTGGRGRLLTFAV